MSIRDDLDSRVEKLKPLVAEVGVDQLTDQFHAALIDSVLNCYALLILRTRSVPLTAIVQARILALQEVIVMIKEIIAIKSGQK